MESRLMQMKRLIERSLNLSYFTSALIKKKKVSRNQVIPNEILFKIFSYCDIDTLFHTIPYVSRQWNSLLTKMSFAGQINIKIYDDQQFKKLRSRMKFSSALCYSTSYALQNASFGYSYGSSSCTYSFNQRNKEKEISSDHDLLPDYHIKLLDSKKSNSEVSMPVVFQIDLALPLSFITVNHDDELVDVNDVYDYNNYHSTSSFNRDNYPEREGDNNSPSSSSSSPSATTSPYFSSSTSSSETSKTELLSAFDLEPIQGYLVEKQKEITQFKAFYFINGIEISIDSDKVISTPPPPPPPTTTNPTDTNNTNATHETMTTTAVESSTSNVAINSSLTATEGNSSLTNTSNEIGTGSTINSSVSLNSQQVASSSSTIEENTTVTTTATAATTTVETEMPTPVPPPIPAEEVPPNTTMKLAELFLEKYRFTPEILKIENVQWSDKFIHGIPRSVKSLELRYLGNPDSESIKNGTSYLHSFIKNLSISSSTILRPRTRRANRFYRPSAQRTTIAVN